MPPLTIRIKKKSDGNAVLAFRRADGSVDTTSIGRHDGFGPIHDLAHYVVETKLGLENGFLGLISQGWNVLDFEKPGGTSRLPDEAVLAEFIAGHLSLEAAAGQRFSVDQFNEVAASAAKNRPDLKVPKLTPETIRALRSGLESLMRRWFELPTGETLDLQFP